MHLTGEGWAETEEPEGRKGNGVGREGSLTEAGPRSGGRLSQGEPGCFGRFDTDRGIEQIIKYIEDIWGDGVKYGKGESWDINPVLLDWNLSSKCKHFFPYM